MKLVLVNLVFAAAVCAATTVSTFAQTKKPSPAAKRIDSIFDCADVSIHFQSDPALTRAENLARMDTALLESLSKFDSCQQAEQFNVDSASAQSIGTAGGGGVSGEGEGEGGNGNQRSAPGSASQSANGGHANGHLESVASSDTFPHISLEDIEVTSYSKST